MLYPFSALLARMKYITRWSLMHSTRAESLSEHTCDTALLAHLLCLIAKHYTGTPCRPEVVAVAALVALASFLTIPVPARILLLLLAVLTGVTGIFVAAQLEWRAGYYECPHCKAQFVPSMRDYVKGYHTLTRRRLTCPHCGRTGMCRHRIVR